MAPLVYMLVGVFVCASAQESTVNYSLREEQDAFTYVGNVARDSQLYGNVTMEVFQRMKFQLLTQGNEYAAMFSIDESASTLRTAVQLDREVICPDSIECVLVFNVAVYLKDSITSVLDLYKIIKIEVTIDDINDNAPEFPNDEVTIVISENSGVETEHFTNGAIDLDRGANNSVQTYVMQPPNEMFGLKVLENGDGTTDLNIVVKYPLDRESRHFYQLVISAIDGGSPPRTGSVKINITISDQNDNSPVFSKSLYNVTVEENIPVNSTIVHVNATDADAEDNGLVAYRFSSRTSSKITDVFDINSESGEITCKSVLNFEDDQKWTFKVEAFDSGSPAKTSTVSVIINVLDINDNYPQININLPPGGTKISEAASPGSFVAHVAVFDLDNAGQKEISCMVIGDDFRLEDFKLKNNYKVIVNKPLDHEVRDSYEVTIECSDNGVPPNKNDTSFIVKVEDVNDNFPEFKKDTYELTIQEEVFQSMIVKVEATDKDFGNNGKIIYKLEPGSDQRFTVNSNTGLVTANSVFDRETDPRIILHVLAVDAGDPALSSTATVVINITDINDNAPRFSSNPLNILIMESEPFQSVNLNVTDPDLGLNGQFTLTFPKNDYLAEYFEFNSVTGEIKTLKAIDRELIPYFKFWVSAVDNGIPQRSSSAEVVLHIIDRNDNIPAITYPNNSNNTKAIPILAPVGFVIATVQASDKDDGLNAQLLYFIDMGDTREIFKMDVNTGRITVGREMTELDADTYKLEIAVRDNGEPQRTAMATLKVTVEPANATVSPLVEEENKQNIMLVAVIVGVTTVISVSIIVSIFILCHIDKRNRGRRNQAPKHPEDRFYDIHRVDESMSGSSNISKDSDAELIKKMKAKKEVSFSIDEDCSDVGNNSTLTNVTSFSTMKPPYLSMDYRSSPEDTQSSAWLCNNTVSDMNKTEMYENELSGLTTSQLQGALRHIAQGGNSDRLWLQPVREEQTKRMILRKSEDNHSTTSHDTTTSDSGRGGSEEDINSNRGHIFSESEESRQYIYQCNNRQTDKLMPRRPPPPIPTEMYPRNISFSDDSVNANTTVVSGRKLPELSPYSMFYQTPLKQVELFTISGRTKEAMLESQMTTPGMPYSVADIEEMSEIGQCRDDASTTTSGSYTINPDDLCNEIDDLFFRDVIV
ncbi:protocadherin-20-like isoform X1 [Mya arenaria]|uniref:protocadherin-20-like isoform X1 n=1 Tax=Mya arenaria TaxID=6604 RepID=UPI0022E30194|nr:protocadherin-20-like isoform X1 [Mya arenaria]